MAADHGEGDDEQPTRADRIKRRFADNRIGAAAIVLVAVMAAVGTVIGGIQAIAGLFGDDSPRVTADPTVPATSAPTSASTSATASPSASPFTLGQGDLTQNANARFGFTVSYPKTWQRSDSADGDGFRAIGPVEGLGLTAYGGYPAPEGEGTDPMNRVFDLLDAFTSDPEVTVLEDSIQQNVPLEGSASMVTGAQLLVQFAGATHLVQLVAADGRDITVQCDMPSDAVATYRGACNQLLASVRVSPDFAG